MRVSAAGWLYDTLEETRRIARLTAVVNHNHPEGIKGAEATASAIFLARTGAGKDEIKDYIISEFGYDLSRSCDEIRPTYHHVESCQKTVPEAITAFLEGTDFEDVIRTAVSLGGDCDTLTCIACSIGEAFFGIPGEMVSECRKRLPDDMLDSLIGHSFTSQDCVRMVPDILQNGEDYFFPIFTTVDEMGEYGNGFSKIQKHFLEAANLARNNEKNIAGIVINAFSEPFIIPRDLFDMIAELPSAFEPKKTT